MAGAPTLFSAFSLLCCVPRIPGSWTDPSLWHSSLEQLFGAEASIPVFKGSAQTRMLVTAPSVLQCITEQMNSLSELLGVLSRQQKYIIRTCMFAVAHPQKSQLFFVGLILVGLKEGNVFLTANCRKTYTSFFVLHRKVWSPDLQLASFELCYVQAC